MNTQSITHIAAFAALTATLGVIPAIPLPFLPVPITAQTLAVMLSGSLLGAKKGALSMLLFMLLVFLGLPLLSGGRGGISVLYGPTIGYFLAWPFASFCIGFMIAKTKPHIILTFFANIVGGILVIYTFGIIALHLKTGTALMPLLYGNLAFIPGDLVKAALATVVTIQVKKSLSNKIKALSS